MGKHTLTLMAWAALSAAPVMVGAQAATTTPPATTQTVAPGTCDCPEGDTRGELRNLAAFAPLGLLGALAAGGGLPAIVDKGPSTPTELVADGRNDKPQDPAPQPRQPDGPVSEGGRNTVVRDIPIPVSADSLQSGLRAPNTGTPLPSVLLLGSGLMAVGCVTLLRSRS